MVKRATSVHINLVVIPQVRDQERNVPNDGALRPSIRAVVRPEVAKRLVLELAVVWENLRAPQRVVLAGELKRLCYFLQCQTPNVA